MRCVTRTRSGSDAILGVVLVVLLCVALAGADNAPHESLRGYCVRVPRPDVLEVWLGPEDDVVLVRLVGLERASLDRAFPLFAQQLVVSRALDQAVRIQPVSRRADGSLLARVVADNEDLSFLLVSEGLARTDGLAPPGLRLELAQEQARAAGLGLWAEERAAEKRRQKEAVRELRLSDIAWRLDAKRRADDDALLSAGVNDDGMIIQLRSWVGVTEKKLVANWGPPDEVSEVNDIRVLAYHLCSEANHTRGTPCTVQFQINGQGYVAGRKYVDG